MPTSNDELLKMIDRSFKTMSEAAQKIERWNSLEDDIKSVENEYVNHCNKVISAWDEFNKEDVEKELRYCEEYFVLMKEGEMIKCDCGSEETELHFEGGETVYIDGTESPSENNIPKQIKKGCFGTCLLEEPSRHPGTKASGGNVCDPYIVGTSWLDTYNYARIENLRMALNKQSWLACKYMGRIMSVDEIENIDTAGMTEEEAFELMLAWVRGEQYIPQVILDKITSIYAGQDSNYFDAYKYIGDEKFDNINKYDVKFVAWSKFVNNLWETEEQRKSHLELRPVLLKAMCMQESSLGSSKGFNGLINILQSINTGDGNLWHLANYNPFPKTFLTEVEGKKGTVIKSNILAWRSEAKENGSFFENGYVEFTEKDYFLTMKDDDGKITYERMFSKGEEDYFGKANIGDKGNPLLLEGIKTVKTNSEYPKGKEDTVSGEMIMVVYNQQSTDMSLYAGAILLANKFLPEKTESKAVEHYNGDGDPSYVEKVRGYLEKMGTDYIN